MVVASAFPVVVDALPVWVASSSSAPVDLVIFLSPLHSFSRCIIDWLLLDVEQLLIIFLIRVGIRLKTLPKIGRINWSLPLEEDFKFYMTISFNSTK